MLVRCFAHSHYNNAVIRGQSCGGFALPTRRGLAGYSITLSAQRRKRSGYL